MTHLGKLSLFPLLIALAGCTAPRPTAPATPPKITLRWSTASEVDNLGFVVRRSESADGPFTDVTEKMISGAGTSETPSSYVWVDTEVERGRTYYYYLVSVATNGRREKFSPVISKLCCKE